MEVVEKLFEDMLVDTSLPYMRTLIDRQVHGIARFGLEGRMEFIKILYDAIGSKLGRGMWVFVDKQQLIGFSQLVTPGLSR